MRTLSFSKKHVIAGALCGLLFTVAVGVLASGYSEMFSANVFIQQKPAAVQRLRPKPSDVAMYRGLYDRRKAVSVGRKTIVRNTTPRPAEKKRVARAPVATQVALAPQETKPEPMDLGVIRQSVGLPVRMKIPSIAVDAAIEKVALAINGAMDVPRQPLNTGWYEYGPRPGEVGSATIAGHLNWINGTTGVFANLNRVKIGDKISVQDDQGESVTFVVRAIKSYGADANASDVFTSNDGKAHLNLITCSGAWDKTAGQYAERLVVFTDRVVE